MILQFVHFDDDRSLCYSLHIYNFCYIVSEKIFISVFYTVLTVVPELEISPTLKESGINNQYKTVCESRYMQIENI